MIGAAFKKVVVIAGCQRSGTTLTGQILGAHPNAMLLDETDGLYPWFDACAKHAAEANQLWEKLLIAADTKYLPGHKRIASGTGRPRPGSHITHVVLKAPNLTYNYDDLARLGWPVSIIYPVRDPRAVVASISKLSSIPMLENQRRLLLKKPILASEFVDEIDMLVDPSVPLHIRRTHMWRIKSSLSNRFTLQNLPVFLFRYEDLVSDPQFYCTLLAHHAELEPRVDLMLSHERIFQGFGPGGTDRSRSIDEHSLNTWSKQLTAEQELDVLRIAAGELRLLGYNLTGLDTGIHGE